MPRLLVFPESDGPLRDPRTGAPTGAYVFARRSAISRAASDVPVFEAQGLRPAIWSGSYAELDDEYTDGGLWASDPRTWGPKGWQVLEERGVQRVIPPHCILRPHARHVISDLPSCRRLLSSEWGKELGISLLIDPASMLAPSMLGIRVVEDHLRRLFEGVTELDTTRIFGLMVTGIALDDQCGTVPQPLRGQGAVDPAVVVAIASSMLAQTPSENRPTLVVFAGDLGPDGRPTGFASGLV
jgi:hypothetical protein